MRGPIHPCRGALENRRAVAAAQQRKVRLQRAAEDLEEIEWGFHGVLHQGGVDEEARELGGRAVQLQELSGGVYVGDGGGAAGGESAADECVERDAAAQLDSQPPGF
ncbi:hypothetical protein SASPL_102714 [Salvia splendens]|uniref:Uncharacterized protein n=1 Tax=Salvia splendens TaxID=180675 RepID=A0A8X8YUA8_SALSN|nr:hypothetical protein SASPL_102714 [Salvia splendens]